MLSLTNIVKEYRTGDTVVAALKGVSIDFREHEFVSILGHSGCGKTTLLNIIGGLDQYTTGDLVINGKSTKEFKDADWDAYRNHSIGFVFQSYNLIPHQTVLANVELALTLSGVSKAERRQRAIDALTKVGLADQIHKKPNQMSGGQMQRVAIARALVNNPDILLADEPTGALDSATSVQIMDILKEISKDKLIIMVTHNPELAELYSSRIVRLQDGLIVSDSRPYTPNQESTSSVSLSAAETANQKRSDQKKKTKRVKNKSMSYFTALSLSMNNLMTKKGRTFLTSFAGSIGIIGIALILSLSNGIDLYIQRVQEDTLSSYPLSIQQTSVDMTSMMTSMMGLSTNAGNHENDAVYTNAIVYEMMKTMMDEIKINDLASFKTFIESGDSNIKDYLSAIQYTYGIPLYVYASDPEEMLLVNPSQVLADAFQAAHMTAMVAMANFNIWSEMLDNTDLIHSQYDLLQGKWPEKYDEIVLVVDENNEVSDLTLYSLGLKDPDELNQMILSAQKGEAFDNTSEVYSYDDILNLTFRAVLPTDQYVQQADGSWLYQGDNLSFMKNLISNGLELKVVGILRPSENAVSTSISGNIGYLSSLTEEMIRRAESSAIVQQLKSNPDIDVTNGLEFNYGQYDHLDEAQKAAYFDQYVAGLDDAKKAELMLAMLSTMSGEALSKLVDERTASMTREEMLQKINENLTIDSLVRQIQLKMIKLSVAQMIAANPEYAEYFADMSDDDLLAMAEEQAGAASPEEQAAQLQQFLAASDDQTLLELVKLIYAEQIATDYENTVLAEYAAMSEAALAVQFDMEYAEKTPQDKVQLYDAYMPVQVSENTYEEVLAALGSADLSSPVSINLYPKDFAAKEAIEEIISEYNEGKEESQQISYTDYVGLLMSSVSTIVSFVSYALIAFVSISLVVSSIMIGIITYISVLERTKEIGILRAIGASKRDISRVFNAETLIVGLVAGVLGILVSLLFCLPINLIISALADVNNIASMPWLGAVILIALSVVLTTIAGLIPSRLAAKKDPVVALRSE